MASIIPRVIARPRPEPPYCRELDPSTWKNGSPSRARCSEGIPMPVSITSMRTAGWPLRHVGRYLATIRTAPWWVNLVALPTRLTSVWRRCASLAAILSGIGVGYSTVSDRPFPRARMRIKLDHVGDRGDQAAVLRAGDVEPAGLDLREVQDVVEESQQVLAVAVYDVQVVALRLGDLRRVHQDLGVSQDRRQRRADLMAHVGQELALGAIG